MDTLKQLIIGILGVLFAAIGIGAPVEVYAGIPAMILATTAIAELFNEWWELHKWKARISVAVVAAILSLVGYFLELGMMAGMGIEQLITTIILVILGAYELWSPEAANARSLVHKKK